VRPDSQALALAAFVALACAACGEEKHRKRSSGEDATSAPARSATARAVETSSAAPSASASAAAPPGSAIAVTLDGKALVVDHALVKRRPDGKLQLYLGQGGGTCEMLFDNVFDGKLAHVLVDLPTRLAADGNESLAVGDVHHHGPQTPDAGASAKLAGAFGAKGEKVALEIDAAAKSAGVSIKGKVSAESCGDEVRTTGPGVPSPALAANGTLTVAGKKLVLRGALVKGDGYELSDFPRDCTAAWFIGARLASKSGSYTLDGTRFADAVTGDGKGLSIKRAAGKPRKQDGVEVVTLELAGTGRVGAFEVSLGGTIEALVCPP